MATEAPSPAVVLQDLRMVFEGGVRRPVEALRGFTMEVPEGAVLAVGRPRPLASIPEVARVLTSLAAAG